MADLGSVPRGGASIAPLDHSMAAFKAFRLKTCATGHTSATKLRMRNANTAPVTGLCAAYLHGRSEQRRSVG